MKLLEYFSLERKQKNIQRYLSEKSWRPLSQTFALKVTLTPERGVIARYKRSQDHRQFIGPNTATAWVSEADFGKQDEVNVDLFETTFHLFLSDITDKPTTGNNDETKGITCWPDATR